MENFKQKSYILAGVVFFIVILTSPDYIYAQNNRYEMDIDNSIKGFEDIALGEKVDRLSNYKLSFMDSDGRPDADGCIKYECHDLNAENTSDHAIEMIGIRTYKNRIVNIYLFFKKENGYHIFQSFNNKYGKYSERTSDFIYSWDTRDVSIFLGYDKPDIGLAVFSSKQLSEEIETAHRQLASQ